MESSTLQILGSVSISNKMDNGWVSVAPIDIK